MRIIDAGKTYIDYWQAMSIVQRGLRNRFGIRVREGLCLAVIHMEDGQINAFGKEFQIPVKPENLPTFVSMIVSDHMLNYPNSDLPDVLSGKKSFQDALNSPRKIEIKRAQANWPARNSDASQSR